MAGPGLLVNNDTTYPDDGSDPSVHLHQTDHDTIHGIVNHIDKDTPPAGNGQVWVSVSGVMTPRALTAADVPSPTGIVRTVVASSTASVNVGFSNQIRYYRVLEGGTITKVRLGVGVQSGNIAVAVYANSGSGLSSVPAARLQTSGSVSCPAPGVNDVALGGSAVVASGDWLAVAADNTSATFYGFTGTGETTLSAGQAETENAFPPPSPAGTVTPGNNRMIVLIGVP